MTDTLSPDQESHQIPSRHQRTREDVSVQIEEAGSVQLDKSQNAEWKERSSTSTGRDAARSINSRRERGPDKLTVNSNARSKQSISVAESDDIEKQQRPMYLRVAMFANRMLKKLMCERQIIRLEDAGVSIEEIEEMKMMSPYSDHKLRKLCGIFLHLDRDKKGFITLDELLSMPEMQANALKKRLACVWAHLENSEISFPDFVATLNVFSKNAPKEQKIKFLFKLYDVDADGKISRDDLKFCLQLVCGKIVEMEVIEKMVTKVFEESDNNGDGFIDFRDFRETLIESDVELKVRLNI